LACGCASWRIPSPRIENTRRQHLLQYGKNRHLPDVIKLRVLTHMRKCPPHFDGVGIFSISKESCIVGLDFQNIKFCVVHFAFSINSIKFVLSQRIIPFFFANSIADFACNLIFHSDRGFQYTGRLFQTKLSKQGMERSGPESATVLITVRPKDLGELLNLKYTIYKHSRTRSSFALPLTNTFTSATTSISGSALKPELQWKSVRRH